MNVKDFELMCGALDPVVHLPGCAISAVIYNDTCACAGQTHPNGEVIQPYTDPDNYPEGEDDCQPEFIDGSYYGCGSCQPCRDQEEADHRDCNPSCEECEGAY